MLLEEGPGRGNDVVQNMESPNRYLSTALPRFVGDYAWPI